MENSTLKKEVENKETKPDFKRQISENWSEMDKNVLKELVRKRVKEIENKNTDTNTNQAEKKAWLDLEKDFNNLCSGKKRSIDQLKSQWMTIKMNAKKEVSEFSEQTKQTGVGQPPPEVPVSANDITVWQPNEFVVDTNEYECDSIQTKQNINDEEKIVEHFLETPLNVESSKGKAKEVEPNEKITPCKQKKVPQKNSVTEENILKRINREMERRHELHLLKIEVEKKKLRNLDLEYEILNAKLLYYNKN